MSVPPTPNSNTQKSGKSPGGKTGTPTNPNTNANTVVNPIPGFTGFSFDFGIDCSAPIGSAILAPAGCSVANYQPTWFENTYPYVAYKFDNPLPGAASQHWYVSEGIRPVATNIGAHFNQGDTVAVYTGPPIEIGWSDDANPSLRLADAKGLTDHSGAGGPDPAQNIYGVNFLNYFSIGGGNAIKGRVNGGAAGGGGTGGGSTPASAFSALITLPGLFSQAEAVAFTGKRAFMADSPLFPFVEQLCQASLRNFMSAPNGDFFAFYPDYFGQYGRKYYWEVRDIEIIDGRIDLSDDPLVTHVGVVGDVTQYPETQVNVFDYLQTSGIFTIFDAIATGQVGQQVDVVTKPTQKKESKKQKKQQQVNNRAATAAAAQTQAITFLQKYGARPYVEEDPMIRSPIFEMFLAFQRFMLLWAKQFQTTFELTFMPEVFPGGLIAFPQHHIQVYVEEVSHNFDYTSGFTTTINVSAPSQIPGDKASRKNISDGLGRPLSLTNPQLVRK